MFALAKNTPEGEEPIVKAFAPGPIIERLPPIVIGPLVKIMLVTPEANWILYPLRASLTACRNEPGPLSFPFVTVMVFGRACGVGRGLGVGLGAAAQTTTAPIANIVAQLIAVLYISLSSRCGAQKRQNPIERRMKIPPTAMAIALSAFTGIGSEEIPYIFMPVGIGYTIDAKDARHSNAFCMTSSRGLSLSGPHWTPAI